MKRKKLENLLPVFLIFLALVVLFLSVEKKLWEKFLPRKPEPRPAPKIIILPTKTPQQKEIIAKVKTYDVFIEEKMVKPKVVGIKLYDQVRFVNKTNKPISVKGEEWGGVPIKPELNMTQAFEKKGRFEYKVPELSPSISGSVVVE